MGSPRQERVANRCHNSNAKGQPKPGMSGLYQVDAAMVGLVLMTTGIPLYLPTSLASPRSAKHLHQAHNCKGRVSQEALSEDNYDLSLLKGEPCDFTPEEHTAQVPSEQREVIERSFKDPDGAVNCLVATPTLEMGVDIGALDMVMMRKRPTAPIELLAASGKSRS